MNESVLCGRHRLRRGVMEDIPRAMAFLDAHWEKGCLLATDRNLFEYEYIAGGNVNFFIAEHVETNAVEAFLGFIQASSRRVPDGFTSMWVAARKSDTKFLGLLLLENWRKLCTVRRCAGTGLRPESSLGMARHMYGGKPFPMRHYYRLNGDAEYVIAEIRDPVIPHVSGCGKRLVRFSDMGRTARAFSFADLPDDGIYKDAWYFRRRYFEHPYYTFDVYGIVDESGCCQALLTCRIVEANAARALRIIDYFGPNAALSGIGCELDAILTRERLEYVDFYCAGIPKAIMNAAGFIDKANTEGNIVPNHFEPYERRNIDIWVSRYWFARKIGMRLFKGDGDQGRPKLGMRP